MTRALSIPVDGPMEVIDITGLVAYQRAVAAPGQDHGNIEYATVYDDTGEDGEWEQAGVALVINEEGKYNGCELNRLASLLFASYVHGDPIMGNVLVIGEVGPTGEDTDVDLERVLYLFGRRIRERMVAR